MLFRSAFLFLLFLPAISFSQTVKSTIYGVAKDAEFKLPLPYVNATMLNVNDSGFVTGTITNEEGRFTFLEVNAGNYYCAFQM